MLHDYGPDSAIGSVHVDVDASLDVAALHRLTRAVQRATLDAFRVFLTVGVYAVDPARRADAEAIENAVLRRPGVKSVHGVFFDDERGTVSFDVLVDFTVRDREALRAAVADDVASLFPGRAVAVNFDTDYWG
ncbi:MAG: heavy-metal-associated domain-containing protein [Fibrobacterales bacterium]|nr:heavy-metal-associated domain-containing protein [Fibrobacterales bacterium]